MAERKNLKIMVDHTFLFYRGGKEDSPIGRSRSELGDLYYYDSRRVDLGIFQHDIDVIWESCSARFVHHGLSDPQGKTRGHFGHRTDTSERTRRHCIYYHLFPKKSYCAYQRELDLSRKGSNHPNRRGKKNAGMERSGSRRESKIYDKGVDIKSREGVYNVLVSYRSGDMWAPKVEQAEALKIELELFY